MCLMWASQTSVRSSYFQLSQPGLSNNRVSWCELPAVETTMTITTSIRAGWWGGKKNVTLLLCAWLPNDHSEVIELRINSQSQGLDSDIPRWNQGIEGTWDFGSCEAQWSRRTFERCWYTCCAPWSGKGPPKVRCKRYASLRLLWECPCIECLN